MRKPLKQIRLAVVFAAGLTALSSAITSAQSEDFLTSPIPSSTPTGITLVEVHRVEEYSSDQYFFTRLGDTDGKTLFYPSSNSNATSTNFYPVLAANDAAAFDDWTLVAHRNASNIIAMQWAYQGNPLYTWSQESEAGEIALNIALYGVSASGEDPVADDGQDGALMPPDGWQIARYTPASSVRIPDGFDLKLVDSSQGVVLTNHLGFSLYNFDDSSDQPESSCTNKECYEIWTPIAASALAIGYGDFSVIARTDNTRQWAFRGMPLFKFKNDLLPGDVHGRDVHPHMQLALLKENFHPQGVNVISQPGYGDMLILNSRTLYFGSAFEKYWGGRSLRGSFDIAYIKGKHLGSKACVSGECLESWHPFTASADAKSSGFWEVISREDGNKQWAYKGFALYTYAGDESIGQIRGHNLYEIADVDGDAAAIARTRLLAEVGNAMGGAGIYWSIAKP